MWWSSPPKLPSGSTGLLNLGNTCFMNSILQCLTHTPQLVEFFIEESYQVKGKLAIEFGSLLFSLLNPENKTPHIPSWFKGNLHEQFELYRQHDAQEFLEYILNGLHDDLNLKKDNEVSNYVTVNMRVSDSSHDVTVNISSSNDVTIEDMDSPQEQKREDASEEHKDIDSSEDDPEKQWRKHKALNNSIIDDTFTGQCKSTLTCPECGHKSVSCEHGMSLSLCIPQVKMTMFVTVILDSDSMRPVDVEVPKYGSVFDLKKALVSACGIGSEVYIFGFISNRTLHMCDILSLLSIPKNTLLVASRYPPVHTQARVSLGEDKEVVQKLILRSKSLFKRECREEVEEDRLSIGDCLKSYLSEEVLGADNIWNCPKCKKPQQARKKLDIERISDVFIIHLRRFSYGVHGSKKLSTEVEVPTELDLHEYKQGKFELYAMCRHLGDTQVGHYIASVKLEDGNWYDFNDEEVAPSQGSSPYCPYILFYRRITC